MAHEFIIDLNPFKSYDITEEDVAKRLMDYSFHGPTMSVYKSRFWCYQIADGGTRIQELAGCGHAYGRAHRK